MLSFNTFFYFHLQFLLFQWISETSITLHFQNSNYNATFDSKNLKDLGLINSI